MNYNWDVSKLTLKFDKKISNRLAELLFACNPQPAMKSSEALSDFASSGGEFSIYPAKSNLFLGDEHYITNCPNLKQLFNYYNSKIHFDSVNYVLIENTDDYDVRELEFSDELNTPYNKLLEKVILNIGGVNPSTIRVMPELFQMISYSESEVESSCNFFAEFLSMIVISDRFVSIGDSFKEFEFQLFSSESPVKLPILWQEESLRKSNFWQHCYSWIISSESRSVGLDLKRKIVGNVITRYFISNSMEVLKTLKHNELIGILDSILNRIISEKSTEFFESMKIVRSEYLEIYFKTLDSISGIMNSILALLVSLIAGVFGIYISSGQTTIFTSPNYVIANFLILIFIGELLITSYFIAKFFSHKRFVKDLLSINEIMFISNENQASFFKGRSKLWIYAAIVIFLFLIVTFLGFCWYSGMIK